MFLEMTAERMSKLLVEHEKWSALTLSAFTNQEKLHALEDEAGPVVEDIVQEIYEYSKVDEKNCDLTVAFSLASVVYLSVLAMLLEVVQDQVVEESKTISSSELKQGNLFESVLDTTKEIN
jgi:hypothetical protein